MQQRPIRLANETSLSQLHSLETLRDHLATFTSLSESRRVGSGGPINPPPWPGNCLSSPET